MLPVQADATSRVTSDAAMPVSDQGLVRGALALLTIALVGLGLLYPLAGVGLGHVFYPERASGSLITNGGKTVGSSLVAQPFTSDRYFQSRPSAAGYDVMKAGGSNAARTNPALQLRIDSARAEIARRDRVDLDAVPSEMITQSGSGLDPDISPQAAIIQIARVAQARGVDRKSIVELVDRHTNGPQFGFLGQPRVNVLELNLALDATARAVSGTTTSRR